MFCKKCGTEIYDGAKFCTSCGTKLEINNEIQVSENASPKSRLAALLFGIFLGGIGVHNFYLGHAIKGLTKVLMLVCGLIVYIGGIVKVAIDGYSYSYSISSIATFSGLIIVGFLLMWIPGIWAFVEWILIACGKAKDSSGLPVTRWE